MTKRNERIDKEWGRDNEKMKEVKTREKINEKIFWETNGKKEKLNERRKKQWMNGWMKKVKKEFKEGRMA